MKVLRAFVTTLVVGLTGVSGQAAVQAGGSQFTTIDDPKGVVGTAARGINLQGDIVGGYADGTSTSHGFLLRHGASWGPSRWDQSASAAVSVPADRMVLANFGLGQRVDQVRPSDEL